MPEKIHYTHCPVCNATALTKIFTVKDYTVSGEKFDIIECSNCSLRFTQDVPDAQNIQAYYKSENYISHTNTSKGFINRLYKQVRKRTLRQKTKFIKKITGLKQGNLLDVGAGTGDFLVAMRKENWQVTGLEPDADARKLAKEKNDIQLAEAANIYALPENQFDAITLWHVLEHVHDLHTYLEKLKAALKENGRMVIAVPNYTAKDASVYKEHWAAYDVPRHLYHFSPQAMKILLTQHGLEILNYKPMWFDSFYVSLLSSKYKRIDVKGEKAKSNLFSAVLNGIRSNGKAIQKPRQCSSVIYVIKK